MSTFFRFYIVFFGILACLNPSSDAEWRIRMAEEDVIFPSEGREKMCIGDDVYYFVQGTDPSKCELRKEKANIPGIATTILVANSGSPGYSSGLVFALFQDRIFFNQYDENFIMGIYRYDPLTSKVELITEFNGFASFSNKTKTSKYLYFYIWKQLWRTDGTSSGTIMLKEYPYVPIDKSEESKEAIPPISFLPVLGDTIYFAVKYYQGQLQIGCSAGTPETTQIIKEFSSEYSRIYTCLHDDTMINSLASTEGNGKGELWIYKGNPGGFVLIKQWQGTPFEGYSDKMVECNGQHFFTLSQSSGLWITDATASGTREIYNLPQRYEGMSRVIDSMVPTEQRLFFTGTDRNVGKELWCSDGTTAGTHLVKDITPGTESTDIESVLPLGRNVLFNRRIGVNNSDLWFSDGTEQGTYILKEKAYLSSVAYSERYNAYAGRVYDYSENNTYYWAWIYQPKFSVKLEQKGTGLREEGDTMALSAVVPGWVSEKATFSWYHDDAKIDGTAQQKLTIGALAIEDSGRYVCRVEYPDEGEILTEDSPDAYVNVVPMGSLPACGVIALGMLMFLIAFISVGTIKGQFRRKV